MRIVIATGDRNVAGGVERYLQLIIPGLLERGHEIALLYENPLDQTREAVDLPSYRLPAWCSTELGVESVLNLATAWNPDLVYSHGLVIPGLEAALLDRFPAILYAHNYYGTCLSGRKCHMVPQAEPCHRRMGPACLIHYYPRRCGGLHPVTMFRMFRQEADRASRLPAYRAILVASEHMFSEFERHGVNANRLARVPLPVSSDSLNSFCPRPPSGRILFVGRLMDLKGCAHLIRALPRAAEKLGRKLTLIVAGDGPERKRLQDLAQQQVVSAEFCGWVSNERRAELFGEAELLAVPSIWPEPFGMTGIEAARTGLPAVAFSVGGIPDWLVAGETGELAPGNPPSEKGLAEAIVRALIDPAHYNRLALGAWKLSGRYNLAAHLDILEPILARHGSMARGKTGQIESSISAISL